jgi:hypothetical protein
MKTRIATGLMVFGTLFQALAQRAENDDMYFRAKDREKLNANEVAASFDSHSSNRKSKPESVPSPQEFVNPTDSYSARNINPEYVSRSNAEQAVQEESYFVEGYTPHYDSYSSANRNAYNSPYNNTWGNNAWGWRNNWYGNPYGWNTWNDPFYSPYYGYGNPWMNPYAGYGSGWSLTMSYYWGNSWGNGWNYGLAYGYGWPYNSSFYSPYYNNWGYPYYGGYYETYRPNYGVRPSRTSALVTPTRRAIQNSSPSTEGSRIKSTAATSDEYYVKPSRRTSGDNTSSGYSTDRTRTTTDYSNTRTREATYNRSSTPTYSAPSRSNSGGSRPSAPVSRPSGGGSRSRGN